ncbi:MAG: 16S rRNA (adenine(1518)-N(6)/adenine(1519)-N(6))-dimethyltransferase RsmA [Terriglobales bacterium]
MPSRLGQNFLVDPHWQARVAGAVAAQPGERILEIGGGRGDLTALLARSGAQIHVVELDSHWADHLRLRFQDVPRVTVQQADILRMDLNAFHAAPGESAWRVFGNLPYYITSPILLHLFPHAAHLQDAVLMVQQEVGERLCAPPGQRAFGILTVTTQLYARCSRLFDLPPGAFRPAPKVTSTLLRLEFAPRAATLEIEPDAFIGFLRCAFAQKRKRLSNNLTVWAPSTAVSAHLVALGYTASARAEQLTLEALATLYHRLRGSAETRSAV